MTAPGILEQCIGNGMTGVATTSAMAGGLALTAAACGTGAGIAAVIGVVAGSCIFGLGHGICLFGRKGRDRLHEFAMGYVNDRCRCCIDHRSGNGSDPSLGFHISGRRDNGWVIDVHWCYLLHY